MPDADRVQFERLRHLRMEHRDLDDMIDEIARSSPFDQIQLQRLKKRKLQIKDQIASIESDFIPNIIA